MKRRIFATSLVIFAVSAIWSLQADPDLSLERRGSGEQSPQSPQSTQVAEAPAAIAMVIDFADGAELHFPKIPWKESMTVLDAMSWVEKHPRGVRFHQQGRGETLFVSQVDDAKNQGGSGLNWVFYVNQVLSDRGCGAFATQAGDVILWRFERYRLKAN